jgi:hypothetical protein
MTTYRALQGATNSEILQEFQAAINAGWILDTTNLGFFPFDYGNYTVPMYKGSPVVVSVNADLGQNTIVAPENTTVPITTVAGAGA